MKESITLTTSDRIELAAIYRHTGQDRIAILLHMMPSTKESWDAIAEALLERGVASLAFDQRGHGGSTMGGTLDYKTFTPEQQQHKRLDLEAALAWAREQGFDEARTILIGASIGANLAIRALAQHRGLPLAIALSPGLDYRGVKTNEAIQTLGSNQKVVLVASDDDDRPSWDSVHELHRLNPSTVLIERHGLGHGTDMTDRDPTLVAELLAFL
ncbi:alpha/beta fold hydrolase [Candidatus Uhrbacteria bacterium]|nr:alpha/beta fold hydrolase [Candidatus Uhrbacteria bacterium]